MYLPIYVLYVHTYVYTILWNSRESTYRTIYNFSTITEQQNQGEYSSRIETQPIEFCWIECYVRIFKFDVNIVKNTIVGSTILN